jgi:hypothetical protein
VVLLAFTRKIERNTSVGCHDRVRACVILKHGIADDRWTGNAPVSGHSRGAAARLHELPATYGRHALHLPVVAATSLRRPTVPVRFARPRAQVAAAWARAHPMSSRTNRWRGRRRRRTGGPVPSGTLRARAF